MSQNYANNLEERTFIFARDVREFVKKLPRTIRNQEDSRQLIRSSGSPGANYIEANECLGKKDFIMHVRISRKESKESRYWLQLVDIGSDQELEAERQILAQEATEFIKIFSAMINNSERKK